MPRGDDRGPDGAAELERALDRSVRSRAFAEGAGRLRARRADTRHAHVENGYDILRARPEASHRCSLMTTTTTPASTVSQKGSP